MKRKPVTIIVPCHRVVGSGRAFGGYGGRLDIKAELLELEGVDLARFDLPNLCRAQRSASSKRIEWLTLPPAGDGA